MKIIASNYNFKPDWLLEHEYVLFDRSDEAIDLSAFTYTKVPNIGSDIYDKLTYIIENYHSLPRVAAYVKSNLFKYITEEEWNEVKDNEVFTPLLTKHHQEKEGVCYYRDGIYWEINNMWYLGAHSVSHNPYELMNILGILHYEYIPFAPGSNYILTRQDIQKHPREFYELLRSHLEDARYPGEAQIIERGLYNIWK